LDPDVIEFMLSFEKYAIVSAELEDYYEDKPAELFLIEAFTEINKTNILVNRTISYGSARVLF
jgi:hypothetical protein